MAVFCEYCGQQMTSAPSHMDHARACGGNPAVAFVRFLAAYESMRRKFGDEYEGRFVECDDLVKRHDKYTSSRRQAK